jgi:beta-glucanase (GH16 family)
MGGSAGTAPGSGGTTTSSSINGCAGESFQLLWQDDFNSLDTSRWQFMTHTLGIAQFAAANASVSGGMATLSLTDAPSGSAMPFQGVEMRSKETFTYGKVESRVRFATGSGVISALVLIYTPWPPPDWNEIDIEFFGKSTNQVQFNTMINVPPADPLNGHLQFPKVVTLGFNATSEFHTYGIEWIPGTVRFLVDGVVQHTATEQMSRMVLPQNILLTIWASDSASWAGATNEASAPSTVQYDWVRVCRYVSG